jgi:hypothetical protein
MIDCKTYTVYEVGYGVVEAVFLTLAILNQTSIANDEVSCSVLIFVLAT